MSQSDLNRVSDWVRNASAVLGVALCGGWSFILLFYDRLGADAAEVAMAPEDLLARSLTLFVASLLALSSAVWMAGFIVNLNGDGGSSSRSVSRTAILHTLVYLASVAIFGIWLWRLLADKPWEGESALRSIVYRLIFLAIAIPVSWGFIAVAVKPLRPHIPIVSLQTYSLFVGAFSLAAAVTGFSLAGQVLDGKSITTPLFRVEKVDVLLAAPQGVAGAPSSANNSEASGALSHACLHYLGSDEGVSVFFDSSARSIVRFSTEAILRMDPCGASPNDDAGAE